MSKKKIISGAVAFVIAITLMVPALTGSASAKTLTDYENSYNQMTDDQKSELTQSLVLHPSGGSCDITSILYYITDYAYSRDPAGNDHMERFGEVDVLGSENFGETQEPDPLNIFPNGFVRYDGDFVDWYIVNVFNMTPEYPSQPENGVYYHQGYYYQTGDVGYWIDYQRNAKCDKLVDLGEGYYYAEYKISGQIVPEEEASTNYIILKEKTVDGKHLWSYVQASENPISEEVIRSYAVPSVPSYTYKPILEKLPESVIAAIKEAVSKKGKGEIASIYELADEIYYVVISLEEGDFGGAIVEAQAEGQTSFRVLVFSKKAMTQGELDEFTAERNAKSNLAIDYKKTADFKEVTDYTNYLEEIIHNAGGSVNDAGKAELTSYIENSITNLSKSIIKSKDNRVTVDGSDIKTGMAVADKAKSEFEKSLKKNDVRLNKELNLIIRIDGSGLKTDQPMQVIFDKSVLEQMDDADAIILLLGDNQHGMKLTKDSLETMIKKYGTVQTQLEKKAEGIYGITFADDKGKTIDKLPASVGFFLPAESELATVLASYSEGSDNWGGQYDKANGAIEFSTKYSGQYEVLKNEIIISDIASRSDQQQQAIRFMVSKGYFKLNGDLFQPDNNLTRYEFTEALVGMFYALDRGASTTFLDVSEDSSHYVYVASAEKDRIVEGYDDQTFKGDLNISKEQMIALCARTLAEKKGYTYPENSVEYLKFADSDAISEWAKEDIALAVREGLITGTGNLEPKAKINRAESAEMLYKLFMLLYQTAPAEFEISESKGGVNPVIPVGMGLIAAGSAGAVFYMRRKRSRKH